MPFIQGLLYYVPTWLLVLFIVALYVGVSLTGLLMVRKKYPHQKCKNHNDIGGFIFATVGVLYAVLLAFSVLIVWQGFDKAQDITVNEASCIGSLYRCADSFPADFKAKLKYELVLYVNAIVDEEWPLMARGRGSENVQKINDSLWKLYNDFQAKTESEKIFLSASVHHMAQISELRTKRIAASGEGIHPLIYFILIIGSIITIAFSMLFGTENIVPHLIMVALMAAMIAISLVTIIAIDYPFTGDLSIRPGAFTEVLSYIQGS
jgi:hypothetical protein